ncbi:flagellar motor protein MotB [Prevotella sp. CAG:891]|nr:flagellar motor protein MotB [Prevotella sp. CAG:891]
MKRLKLFVPLAIALLMTGCVSKKQYADMQAKYQTLQSENASLQRDLNDKQVSLAECNSNSKSLAERLADEQARNKEMREAYSQLQNSYQSNVQAGNVNISKLVDEINASNKFIKQLVDAKSKSDSLNQALTNKLTRSLSREEMNDVDVQVLKGVVYISLADNMLYKSGSYEIGDRAGETLSKIAKIISDYKDYDVLVEGNTDNVPIKQKNIRNNWDLSTLRASSVVQALQNEYGVDPKRLTAAGRGEYNPVANNSTEKGKQRNRRTQIIITPKLDQFMDLIDEAPEQQKN